MKKRILAVLVLATLLVGMLAACGNDDGPLTADDAQEIVLKDLGVKESKVDSLDVHITTSNGEPCYAVYVTIDGEHLEYVIHGLTGEILSKEETDSGHSH